MINKTELINGLKELTASLGRYPTKKEIDESNITHHSSSYYEHFRRLKDAFEELSLVAIPRCKLCRRGFKSNQALSAHLLQKKEHKHIKYINKLKKLNIQKIKKYKNKCSICDKRFKTKKGLNDHIFSFNKKDKLHMALKDRLREERFKNCNKRCPVCGKRLIRNLGMHLIYSEDIRHENFYRRQKVWVIRLFKKFNSFYDMTKFDNRFLNGYSQKHFSKICLDELGKNKLVKISKKIHSIKRRNYWKNISLNKRKKIMKTVRDAEWSKLNSEQRKKHPWVIAGRRASLKSSKKGSKNQRYAFQLLKQKLPYIEWKYNYLVDDEWHIDIAAPERLIFIEWDGRHHFIPIHGISYLNNRINRDKIKNKIITKQLNGCLIRIKDTGRANQEFVEEKINMISKILKQEIPKGELIQL